VAHSNPPDTEIRQLLASATTIAVVGASSNPERPSNNVMRRLQQLGYRVIPVNPNETQVLGEKAYASLADVPISVDIVDVFRRAEYTPAVADDAVKVHAKTLWLQQGVWNEEAAAHAKAGGLTVIMDACIAVEVAVLQVPPPKRRA
jgi:predicted CoA-binding protein